MAAELEEKFPGVSLELIRSSGGRFEVMRDGVPVFEKSKLGRHAQPGEIARLIEQQLAAS